MDQVFFQRLDKGRAPGIKTHTIVALLKPDERLGAVVFYSQQLQHTLASTAQLQAFLAASPDNIAVVEDPEIPGLPLTVVDKVSVGRHHYYFVSLAALDPGQ